MEEKCEICGRSKDEYKTEWPCAKNHNWRASWRKDKTTEKYKEYLKNRNKSMKKAVRRRLEKLNKTTPEQYKNRKIKI